MKIITIITFWTISFNSILLGQTDFENANKEYKKGNFGEAIRLFSESIKNNNEVAKSFMLRGSAKGMNHDFSNAIIDLNSSYQIDSLNYNIYYYYGRTYMINGFNYSAIKYYDKALKINKYVSDIYDDRALAKIAIADYTGAIADEDSAIKLNSKVSYYYLGRGWAKYKLNKLTEAIKDFDSSIVIQSDPQAYSDRGLAYFDSKEYLKAIADFSEALRIAPLSKQCYYHRALSYKALNKIDEACLDFNKCIELNYSVSKIEYEEICGKK